MLDDEEADLRLRPIESEFLERQARASAARLKKAADIIEFEQLNADAKRVEDFTVRDLDYRYGIRHIVVATALTSIVLSLYLRLGQLAGFAGCVAACIIGGLLFVSDWQRQKLKEISTRQRQVGDRLCR